MATVKVRLTKDCEHGPAGRVLEIEENRLAEWQAEGKSEVVPDEVPEEIPPPPPPKPPAPPPAFVAEFVPEVKPVRQPKPEVQLPPRAAPGKTKPVAGKGKKHR